ncbi:CobW family GTP-binding protein [Bacillus massiliglaciei]|uniref:CobW family GTP-binding protein n=1 Tax=Bacillus massiliglaciei TaxID=1816693 RepID=UPI000ABDDBFD|nr:CobW family GTP-binding protein [Bacillus massiliglaciei]
MKRTEIFILGGFLGSGKTTLLRNILKEESEAGRKAAVLLNELGSISIDTAILDENVPLKELFDGCICCTIQDKLEVQLHDLLMNNDLDVIYIETTGAAHPVEVLDAILSPVIADRLEYRGIITVVDLNRWKDRELLSPQLRQLLLEQVRHADFIVMNKKDLVTEMEAAQMVYSIQSINPNALCLLTEQARISLSSFRQKNIGDKKEGERLTIPHLHLEALTYTFSNSVSKAAFEKWLRSLPETIYRMKGYIAFTNSQYPSLFQYSYGMPIYMEEMIRMPLNLVIIGEQMNIGEMKSQLEKLEEQ